MTTGTAPAPVPGSGAGPAAVPAALRRAVLAYGRTGLRSLPWRSTRDPWAILVSEVMLQQTSVARVTEPYARFLALFPTVRSCAAAALGDVVRAWAGLGYNRRARNLHRAATVMVAHHRGRVPDDLDALRALPGVGPYTARAVSTFAFGTDEAVVDVNVARVIARAVSGCALTPAQTQRVADGLVPRGRGWAWNQALMEIGALACGARAPRCDDCPLRRCCAWSVAGRPDPDPAAARRPPTTFAGSDRQGRGRLVAAARVGPVARGHLASACGWPDDPARVRRVVDDLVADGLVRRGPGGVVRLA